MTQEATQAGECRAPRSQDAGRNAKPESQGPENLPPLSFLPPAHKREPAAAPPALPRPRETPTGEPRHPPQQRVKGSRPPSPIPARRRSQLARGIPGAAANPREAGSAPQPGGSPLAPTRTAPNLRVVTSPP